MAKRPTINTLTNTASPTYLTQLNQNFSNIQAQFDNTLSLDGSLPNAMNADLDLNDFDLINAGTVNADNLVVAGTNLNSVVAQAATSATNAATSASAAAASAATASQYTPAYFTDVAELLADTRSWPTGQILNTREEGFAYEVVTSGQHVTTAGGVKLIVLPGASGYNVKAFGAKGDGTTNDTASLAIAFGAVSSGTLVFPTGNYIITSTEVAPLLFSASNSVVVGYGATIKNSTSRSFATFGVSGDNVCIEGLCFDGLNTSLGCLFVADTAENVTITNCEVKNFAQQLGDATFAVGVLVKNGSNNTIIRGCHIHDIQASVTGISRGVLGSGYGTAQTKFDGLTVSDCLFEDIGPTTDGDAIVFQPDTATEEVFGTVSNCTFRRVAKRAVKIQGSKCSVIGGFYVINSGTAYSAVSVYGDDCRVIGMEISGAGALTNAIDIGATGSTIGANTVVSGCSIQQNSTAASNDGIRVYGAPNNVSICGNVIDTARHGVHLNCTGIGVSVQGNTIRNIGQVGVLNAGVSGTFARAVSVTGNAFSSVTGFSINNAGGGEFVASGNSSDQSGTGTNFVNSLRNGNASNLTSTSPVVTFGAAAPVAGTWLRGDIVYRVSPSAGGKIGWVCTLGGTPGTWKEFGAIDA